MLKAYLKMSVAAIVLIPSIALALPVGYIDDPNIDKGAFELEYNMTRTDDSDHTRHNTQAHEIGAEYSFGEDWKMEAGGKVTSAYGEDTRFSELFLESQYQMTEQDEGWWLDTAVLGEYAHSLVGGANELEVKFLASRETDNFKHIVNLIAEREVGENHGNDTEFVSRLSSMYKLNKYFNPAVEWHAEWGNNHNIPGLKDQEHFVGPAAYGALFNTGTGEIEYELGYLFGVTDPAEDGVLRLKLEYETAF